LFLQHCGPPQVSLDVFVVELNGGVAVLEGLVKLLQLDEGLGSIAVKNGVHLLVGRVDLEALAVAVIGFLVLSLSQVLVAFFLQCFGPFDLL